MKLNKRQIKEYVEKHIKDKIYNLSVSRDGTSHTFKEDSMSTKIWTDAQQEYLDVRFNKIDQRLDNLEQDVAELKTDMKEVKHTLKLIVEHLGIVEK